MRADETRRQDALAWLARAELDLRAARYEVKEPSEQLSGEVMFHAQRAAEKALKAFLAWHDVAFRKTHNLDELGHQCASVEAAMGPVASLAAPLTEYAWRFRYPGEPAEPTRAEAEAALETAQAVYAAVTARVR